MLKLIDIDNSLEAIRGLKQDQVLAIPTDTVYGLCGYYRSHLAFEKIKKMKNRPDFKSLPIMVADLEQLMEVAIVNGKALKLIKKYMPGPLTIILKRNPSMPAWITNEKDTIAIRLADRQLYPIIKASGPVFLTSANISGEKECYSSHEVVHTFSTVDIVIKGEAEAKQASTIVDCTQDKYVILRPGPISEKEIKEMEKC